MVAPGIDTILMTSANVTPVKIRRAMSPVNYRSCAVKWSR